MTVTIALPSKGRIRDGSIEAFEAAGIQISAVGNERSYRGRIDGIENVEVAYLSASEIARELGRGSIDIGLTGEDLVREDVAALHSRVAFRSRLGFGKADVVVAVPEVWFDVDTMADLGDVAADFRLRHGRRLRIATKYWSLTQQFFSAKHGIQVYRIVESLGATEGAPASGQADIIVDITSTGSTLKANHLKILTDGVILQSEVCLVEALKDRTEEDRDTIESLVSRIEAALGPA
ncbi:ATP phosphoribosyltransferase [Hoeflea sp. WL0058]|uniref:ATP phosphoribosyltransferase n=1 Tax=Flavimaribacter sediminis TaxID=2865987 RepID=A0AAE2ZK46_9HYPH|nr:ATP phosphoribosyltransferase [Flavimaribacter sediminis]MBW8637424.1 ATP phosphoribosyltransferase [Flavimaribacter sediminis]